MQAPGPMIKSMAMDSTCMQQPPPTKGCGRKASGMESASKFNMWTARRRHQIIQQLLQAFMKANGQIMFHMAGNFEEENKSLSNPWHDRVIFWTEWDSSHQELVPYNFAYNANNFLSTCGKCSEVVFEFKWRATYYGRLRAKLILAPLGMPKWVWPSMNPQRMFLVQTSTLPPSMDRKLTKRERWCMQNN